MVRKTRKCKKALHITKKDAALYVGSVEQKGRWWVSISDSLLYISRDTGRSYWMLQKVRPTIHFSDTKQTVRIASNRLVIHSPTLYNCIKGALSPLTH